VTNVPFLGAAVGFDGTLALAPTKWRVVLRDLRARITRTARLMPDDDPETRARVLASVVADAFDPRSEIGVPHRPMLRDLVSSRRQLAELDYWIALRIAEAATGARGARAFRELPYAWLREEAGLPSRLVTRNGGRFRARAASS
jgi:hypothetical protein